ncbi:MAG: MFS transporter [Myxococcota bacterium]
MWRLWRDAYAGLPPTLWRLALVCLLNRMGTMVLPFLSLYLTQEVGLSAAAAGGMLTAWGLGSMAGAWMGGWLTDGRGPRFTLLLSLCSAAVAYVVLGYLPVPWIPAGLFVTAALADMFRPAAMASLPRLVAPKTMPRAVGLIRATVNLGMAIGPALGGVLATVSYGLLFWVDGASCLIAAAYVAVAFTVPPLRERSAEEKAEAAGASTGRLPLFFGILAIYVLCFLQYPFAVPVFMKEVHGASEALVGLAFALNTLMIVALEMLILRRTEAWPPLRAMALGASLVGLAYLVIPLGGPFGVSGLWVVFVGTIVWTVGEMICDPMMATFVSRNSDPERQGRAMSLLAIIFGLGFTLAPGLGLGAYGALGAQPYFALVALTALGVSLAWWALSRAQPVPGSAARVG